MMNTENQEIEETKGSVKIGRIETISEPSKAYETDVLKNLKETLRSVSNHRNSNLGDENSLNLSKSELLNLLDR